MSFVIPQAVSVAVRAVGNSGHNELIVYFPVKFAKKARLAHKDYLRYEIQGRELRLMYIPEKEKGAVMIRKGTTPTAGFRQEFFDEIGELIQTPALQIDVQIDGDWLVINIPENMLIEHKGFGALASMQKGFGTLKEEKTLPLFETV